MPWGVAAAVGGALIAGKATKSAAKTQAKSADNATELQWEMFQQQRSDTAPGREAYGDAINRLQLLLGLEGKGKSGYGSLAGPITASNVENEAGYQFGLTQGNQAIERAAAAQGRNLSGATLKALQRYSQDYAGTKYNDAFNREIANRNQQLNPLMSVAGVGQVANQQIAQAGQNYANNASNNMMQVGNVQAAAGMSNANNWINAGNNALALWMRNSGSQQPATTQQQTGWQGYGGTASDPWYG